MRTRNKAFLSCALLGGVLLVATGVESSRRLAGGFMHGTVDKEYLAIVSGRVDQIQQYAGFTLTLFSSLAVSCVIMLRIRRPEVERPFKAWGYPASPLLFLGASLWMMFWAFRGRPVESVFSLLTVLLGGLIFALFASRRGAPQKTPQEID